MALQSRSFVMSRRGTAIADLNARGITDGSMDVNSAITHGILKINCSHQIGIATQTEIGLAPSRYPIRVVVIDPKMKYDAPTCDTVCGYWSVKHADGKPVAYSRKPSVDTVVINNMYKCVPDLDNAIWMAYETLRDNKAQIGQVTAMREVVTSLYDMCKVLNPTPGQMAEISEMITRLLAEAVEANRYGYFQVGDNAFLFTLPHGRKYTALHGTEPEAIAVYEAALTLKLNYLRLKARYENLSEGVLAITAYCIMVMFREGLSEGYESTEYHTVTVSISGNEKYNIEEIFSPRGAGNPEGLKVGDELEHNGVMFDAQLVEVAGLIVMVSGLMHYLFNHTTGGTVVSGTLLTILAMFNYISVHSNMEEQTAITGLIYEALHPVNKRAIANIFFEKSNVVTHGRLSTFRRYEQFKSDAFFQIRSNPFPAGSHKAYICLTALRRVLQAGLGPFLPWADQITACINTCRDVLTAGARSHIGSFYYTGDPPLVQPSSLDHYLPELATYLHTFNKGDSLTMSPHMSPEVANRSGMNWQNLLKDLKAKDISSTPAETVRAYLSTAGAVNYTFDPNDESTWGKAASDSSLAQKVIASVFG